MKAKGKESEVTHIYHKLFYTLDFQPWLSTGFLQGFQPLDFLHLAFNPGDPREGTYAWASDVITQAARSWRDVSAGPAGKQTTDRQLRGTVSAASLTSIFSTASTGVSGLPDPLSSAFLG